MLTLDLVSPPSRIMEAQTDKLAMGAKGVVQRFQGLQVFAHRSSSHNCELDT